ncbi:hypothetical protein NKG05_13515 [Oerskovia sp. M15]
MARSSWVGRSSRTPWPEAGTSRCSTGAPTTPTRGAGPARRPLRRRGSGRLAEGEWDVAVDTWSWAPSAVRDAARPLSDRVGRYVYVSSRSVYTYPTAAGLDEDAPVVEASPDDRTHDDYARAKRGGELAAQEAFGHRAILARAGLILGPWRTSGACRGGCTASRAVGPYSHPAARAAPAVRRRARPRGVRARRDRAGAGRAFNVVSPSGHTTMGELLDACVAATGSDAELRWTAPDVIEAAGIAPGPSCRSGCRRASCTTPCTAATSRARSRRACATGPSRRRSRTRGHGCRPCPTAALPSAPTAPGGARPGQGGAGARALTAPAQRPRSGTSCRRHVGILADKASATRVDPEGAPCFSRGASCRSRAHDLP